MRCRDELAEHRRGLSKRELERQLRLQGYSRKNAKIEAARRFRELEEEVLARYEK